MSQVGNGCAPHLLNTCSLQIFSVHCLIYPCMNFFCHNAHFTTEALKQGRNLLRVAQLTTDKSKPRYGLLSETNKNAQRVHVVLKVLSSVFLKGLQDGQISLIREVMTH